MRSSSSNFLRQSVYFTKVIIFRGAQYRDHLKESAIHKLRVSSNSKNFEEGCGEVIVSVLFAAIAHKNRHINL